MRHGPCSPPKASSCMPATTACSSMPQTRVVIQDTAAVGLGHRSRYARPAIGLRRCEKPRDLFEASGCRAGARNMKEQADHAWCGTHVNADLNLICFLRLIAEVTN